MKSNVKSYILILTIFAQTAIAQHEGCNHGDAPSSDISHAHKIVQIPHEAENNINLKTEKASSRKIDTIITALGTAQNIPEQQAEVSSRIEGKVIDFLILLIFSEIPKDGKDIGVFNTSLVLLTIWFSLIKFAASDIAAKKVVLLA